MIFGKNVNKYYLKYWYMFLIGVTALILVDYFQLQIPEIIGDVVDKVYNKTMTLAITKSYVLELLLVALVMLFGRFIWRIAIFGVGLKIETDLRAKLFEKSLKLSQNYYQNNKTGAIMALYTNDLQAIRGTFGSGTIMLIDALFLGSMAIIKMLRLNVLLTLVSSLPLFLLALCGGIIGKYMNQKYGERQKAYENLSDFSQEAFSGIQVIKAFVLEGKQLLRYRKLNKENIEKNLVFVRLSILLDITLSALISSIFIIISLYGGSLVYKSTPDNMLLSAGELTKFISFFDTLIWPMIAIAQMINLRSQGKASLTRIDELLNEKIDIENLNSILLTTNNGKIEFRNFTFSYPDTDKVILDNINLTINSGEHIGIVGKTGSGKTTLVDVLLRLYNVEKNQIFIDDIDIMRLDFKQVRDMIGYVPQDNFLYSDTIKNNIAFSKDQYDIEEVINSAKFADVDKNIQEFKDGYDTILGERGATVSGGQKQRISIARAIFKDPTILILDDSVSAVDTKTEEHIINNLFKERKNKTTILIAHRISTIKRLDKIILIDEGKVVGFGSHDELMKKSSLYKEMVLLQQLEEEAK